ncbi:MAG: hypothetical protein JW910_23300, partial [Anaerolineae bacterium]|nr:hypothetical protein [Anaerolineae bacterium]
PKRRVNPENGNIQFCDGPVPVRHLYVLTPPDDSQNVESVNIEPLSVREGVIRLLECSFRLDITDRARNAREFETLTRLAERLPMYRLSYPRRYEMLPAVREAILAHSRDTGQHE